MQLERWISQHVARPEELRQRRSYTPHRDAGVIRISTKREASDHHFIVLLHVAARADVRQDRVSRLIVIVNFDQADTGGVVPSGKLGQDHRFAIIGRLEDGVFELRSLWAIHPVVVEGNQRPIGPVQFQVRIVQERGRWNIRVNQRRSQPANHHVLRGVARNDEAGDHRLVPDVHAHAGR